MCLLCAETSADVDLAARTHVLQLLSLVEHPDALPPEAALRLGREVMALVRPAAGPRWCEPIKPDASQGDMISERGLTT